MEHQDNSQRCLPRDANEEEIETLTHDLDDIPTSAWLLAFTGAAANLARYGVQAVWQNYLQNRRGDSVLPGALGLGQAQATTIQNGFLFFGYLTPLPFALISDSWIGRYKTLLLSIGLLSVAYIVQLITSLPASLDNGAGLGGIIVTMILSGLGHGGLSAVMYPFIADQIPDAKPRVKRNRKGDPVVTDRKLSIQYVFNGYYWMVNVASLSSIPTTLLEKHVDFWAAYLLPTCLLVFAVVPVIVWNGRLVKVPPQNHVLPEACRVLLIACSSGFHLSAADPEFQATHHSRRVPWKASFVNEIRRGLKACRIIACFVIFWLCYNQTSNNFVSQAGQMEQNGISNDTIQALNPIACIIMAPLIQGVFPLLRRRGFTCGPIMRMTLGFFFVAAGLAYAAGLQSLIYSRPPCFDHPLECSTAMVVGQQDGNGGSQARPNEISVWAQTPLHFLLAIGEILDLVSLSEYTYNEAPANIKAVVQALQHLAAAIAAALGMTLGSVSRNPKLVIMYASLAGIMAVSSVLFWFIFIKYDDLYEKKEVEATGPSENEGCDQVSPG